MKGQIEDNNNIRNKDSKDTPKTKTKQKKYFCEY
jgi:hypothetical protein